MLAVYCRFIVLLQLPLYVDATFQSVVVIFVWYLVCIDFFVISELAIQSAASFSGMPTWLGTHHRTMSRFCFAAKIILFFNPETSMFLTQFIDVTAVIQLKKPV